MKKIKLNDLKVSSFVTMTGGEMQRIRSGEDGGATGGTADCSHCCPVTGEQAASQLSTQ